MVCGHPSSGHNIESLDSQELLVVYHNHPASHSLIDVAIKNVHTLNQPHIVVLVLCTITSLVHQ